MADYQRERQIEMVRRELNADLVEVVRCKDCKHYRVRNGFVYEEGCGRCDHPQQCWDVECFDQWVETRPDDFCSYGERKEQNG